MVAHPSPPQIRTRKFACIRLLTSHLSPQLHLRVFRCHTGEVLCPRRVPDPQTYDAASPFLHRVQEGLFPRFIDTMGRSDSVTRHEVSREIATQSFAPPTIPSKNYDILNK